LLQDNGKTNLSKLRNDYISQQTQLTASQAYEAGLLPYQTKLDKSNALLAKLKSITDAKGQTEAYKKLDAMRDPGSTDIKFTITDPSGVNRVVTRNWNDILKKYGIVYKEGGKFENVRKYQNGNPIRNVQGNADWFNHMYKHKSMQDWLNTWDAENYEDFNKLQDSWWNNLQATGYDPNNPEMAKGEGTSSSAAVLQRQKEWNATGTNAAIEDANTLGILKRNGGTKDNAKGQYQDGYFGAQEYLRHGGTDKSWKDHTAELDAQREAFKKKGLDYYQDENGMFKLRPLKE
jgi:hypothetical protein